MTIPEIYTPEEMEEVRSQHYIHEQGKVCNINPGYSNLIDVGFDAKREEIYGQISIFKEQGAMEEVEYLELLLF